MNLHQRDRIDGETIQSFLDLISNDMTDDGYGLGAILGTGRVGYSFSGPDLDAFIHLCVRTMVEAGGVPLVHGHGAKEDLRYAGLPAEVIADRVLAEWHAMGEPDPGWYEFWFMDRATLAAKRAQLAKEGRLDD